MERIAVLVNGKHKHRLKKEMLVNQFPSSELFYYYSEFSRHLTTLTKEALENKCTSLVIVGGDGSVNEVANAIVKTDKTPSLYILPIGTGNDYARSIKGRKNVRYLQLIDKDQELIAANIFDVGFGGCVVNKLERLRKVGLRGKLAYAASILWSFLTFKKKEITLIVDGITVYSGKTLLTAFCKGKVFGYGLTINPDAEVDDNKVYITLIGDISLFNYLKHLGKLKRGDKIEHEGVHYFNGTICQLELSEENCDAEFDGEFRTISNASIKCTANSFEVSVLT